MSDVLYFTGLSHGGNGLIGGLFRMKDEHGFPLDVAHDILKENGLGIDCLDLLCATWLHDCLGFNAIVRELKLLGFEGMEEKWKDLGSRWLNGHPEAMSETNPVDCFCRAMLELKCPTLPKSS